MKFACVVVVRYLFCLAQQQYIKIEIEPSDFIVLLLQRRKKHMFDATFAHVVKIKNIFIFFKLNSAYTNETNEKDKFDTIFDVWPGNLRVLYANKGNTHETV